MEIIITDEAKEYIKSKGGEVVAVRKFGNRQLQPNCLKE